MQHNNTYNAAVVCLILVAISMSLSACYVSKAPKNWLSDSEEATRSAFGGWVTVNDAQDELVCVGELIAVHDTGLHCLSTNLIAIPRDSISEAVLFGYDSNHDSLAGGTVLGVLGSISNGWLGIFTVPLWIIGGSASAATQSGLARIKYDGADEEWFGLRTYARFPQGMPTTVSVESLRNKGVD